MQPLGQLLAAADRGTGKLGVTAALTVRERAGEYFRLVRLHRPIGTLLLLWPTLWALFIASGGMPRPYTLFAFTLGTLLMRSAGCAINDWADRNFDGAVERTRDRPLAAGRIDLKLGLRTSAITFGRHDVAAVMACYLLALALIGWAGVIEGLWPWIGVGLLLAAGVAVYHFGLIRDRSREGCFKAFNHNTWFGAAVFGGVVLALMLR